LLLLPLGNYEFHVTMNGLGEGIVAAAGEPVSKPISNVSSDE
jgi:hypothetical protein